MKKYAIIAGTGYDNYFEKSKREFSINKFGKVEYNKIKYDDFELYYIPRHGYKHSISPSNINYRANAYFLKEFDISHVFGICAVGSLKKSLKIGDIILNIDFLDMTKNRITTFFEKEVKHLEVSEPYSKDLNNLFISEANKYDIEVKKGVYVCTEGPRFESTTEIELYKLLNCDVVGMTNIPEVLLIKELDIAYSCASYVTNYCTGINGIIKSEDFTSQNIKKDLIIKTILDVFKKDPLTLGIKSNRILL